MEKYKYNPEYPLSKRLENIGKMLLEFGETNIGEDLIDYLSEKELEKKMLAIGFKTKIFKDKWGYMMHLEDYKPIEVESTKTKNGYILTKDGVTRKFKRQIDASDFLGVNRTYISYAIRTKKEIKGWRITDGRI